MEFEASNLDIKPDVDPHLLEEKPDLKKFNLCDEGVISHNDESSTFGPDCGNFEEKPKISTEPVGTKVSMLTQIIQEVKAEVDDIGGEDGIEDSKGREHIDVLCVGGNSSESVVVDADVEVKEELEFEISANKDPQCILDLREEEETEMEDGNENGKGREHIDVLCADRSSAEPEVIDADVEVKEELEFQDLANKDPQCIVDLREEVEAYALKVEQLTAADDEWMDEDDDVSVDGSPESVDGREASPRVPVTRLSHSLSESIYLQQRRQLRNGKAITDSGSSREKDVISSQSSQAKSQKVRQHCFFCKASVVNIVNHLGKHSNEPELARFASMGQSSSEQEDYLREIKRLVILGNFMHNVRLLRAGKANFVLGDGRAGHKSSSTCLPCVFCYKFYRLKDLGSHVKEEHGERGLDVDQIKSLGRVLLDSACLPIGVEERSAEDVKKSVIRSWSKSDLRSLVERDRLIHRFGGVLHRKFKNWRIGEISEKMKQLGQLLLVLQKASSSEKSLESYISVDYFDDVVETAKLLDEAPKNSAKSGSFQNTVSSLKLGFLLAEVANVKQGWALQTGNGQALWDAEKFLERLLCKNRGAASSKTSPTNQTDTATVAASSSSDRQGVERDTDEVESSESSGDSSDTETSTIRLRKVAKQMQPATMYVCLFCKFRAHNLLSHYVTKHCQEPEVLTLLRQSKSDRKAFSKGIRRLGFIGNFLHNVSFLRGKGNGLVASKRLPRTTDKFHYLPCMYCYDFYDRHDLGKHTAKCEFRTGIEHGKFTQHVSFCKILLESACLYDENSRERLPKISERILKCIPEGDVRDAVSKDKLILRFGASLLKTVCTQSSYKRASVRVISRKMSQLGTLLLHLREKSETTQNFLETYISGESFHRVIQAAREVLTQTQSRILKLCSSKLSLAVGHLLGMVGNFKRGWALACGNKTDLRDAEDFMECLLSKESGDIFVTAAPRPKETEKVGGDGMGQNSLAFSNGALNKDGAVEPSTEPNTTGSGMKLRHVVLDFKPKRPERKNQAQYQQEYRERLKSKHQWQEYKERQKGYNQRYLESLTEEQRRARKEKKGSEAERVPVNTTTSPRTAGKIRRKIQYCLFCENPMQSMVRHLLRGHRTEPEIASLLSLRKSKGKREEYLRQTLKLRARGNFLHNVKVLQQKDESDIVVKRLSERQTMSKSHCFPCLYCLDFISRRSFGRHLRDCPLRENCHPKAFSTNCLNLSKVLLESACLSDKEEEWILQLKESVLPKTRRQDAGLLDMVIKDGLIMCCGATWLQKSGRRRPSDFTRYLICYKMIQLATLLTILRKTAALPMSLTNFITGEYFSYVIKAAQELCEQQSSDGENRGEGKAGIPSLPVNIGNLLAEIASVKRGQALASRNREDLSDAESFWKSLHSQELVHWLSRAESKRTIKKRVQNTLPTHETDCGGNANTVKFAAKRNLKKDYCLFCKMPTKTLRRHFFNRHSKQPEVSQLIARRGSTATQKDYLGELKRMRHLGNFLHNIQVLQRKASNFVVNTRPQVASGVSSFYSCLHCLRIFFTKRNISMHMKQCSLRRGKKYAALNKNCCLNEILVHSACLSDNIEEWSPQVREAVLANISTQDVSIREEMARDMMVMRCGASLLEILGEKGVQEVEQLGKLLVILDRSSPPQTSLSSFVSGECFNEVIKAVAELVEPGSAELGVNISQHPPVDLKMGRLLAVVGTVKRGQALQNRNQQDLRDAESFIDRLLQLSFSKPARRVPKRSKSFSQVKQDWDESESDDEMTPPCSDSEWEEDSTSVNNLRKTRVGLRDKRNYCLFCKAPFHAIVKHLLKAHAKTSRVTKLLKLQNSESHTSDIFENETYKLTCIGNFLRNVQVLNEGGSEMVAVKRSMSSRTQDYLPCVYCYGFLGQADLPVHMDACKLRGGPEHKRIGPKLFYSKLLLESACLSSKDQKWLLDVREFVLKHLGQSNAFDVISKDGLILLFGASLYKLWGEAKAEEIAEDMAELGTLLADLRDNSTTNSSAEKDLSSFIVERSFQTIVKVAQKPGANALSLKIGYLLTAVGNVKRGWALQCGLRREQRDAEKFLEVLLCRKSGALFVSATPENRTSNHRMKTVGSTRRKIDGEAGQNEMYAEQSAEDIEIQQNVPKARSRAKRKRNYCLFCGQRVTVVIRHVIRHHRREPAGSLLVSLKGAQGRRLDFLTLCLRLRCFGNFLHNIKVLKGKDSGLKVSRGKVTSNELSGVLPCLFCFDFLLGNVDKHMKACLLRNGRDHRVFNENNELSRVLRESACLSDEGYGLWPEVKDSLSPYMIGDEGVFKVIERDWLLMHCAVVIYNMHDKQKAPQLFQKLLHLAKLLSMLENSSSQKSLSSFISGNGFEEVMKAAGRVSNPTSAANDDEGISPPIVNFQIGHLLGIVGNVKRGWAIQRKSNQEFQDAELFLFYLQRKQQPASAQNVSEQTETLGNIPLKILNTVFCVTAAESDFEESDFEESDELLSTEGEETDSELQASGIEVSLGALETSEKEKRFKSSSNRSINKKPRTAPFRDKRLTCQMISGNDKELDSQIPSGSDKGSTRENGKRLESLVTPGNDKRMESLVTPGTKMIGKSCSVLKGRTVQITSEVQTRKNFCMFCKVSFRALPRHIFRFHLKDPRVSRLMQLKKSASTYEVYLKELFRMRCMGNFLHNLGVLKGRTSNFVAMAGSSRSRPLSEYLPCLFCYGFFGDPRLNRHMDRCRLNDADRASEYKKFNYKCLLNRFLIEGASVTKEKKWAVAVKETLLQTVGRGKIFTVVSKDRLLLRFATGLFKFTHMMPYDVSHALHQVGMLLLLLQKRFPANRSLASYISSESFYDVMEAAEKISGATTSGDGEQVFESPALFKEFGFSMALIGCVMIGWALSRDHRKRQEDAEKFLSRLLKEWPDSVSPKATAPGGIIPEKTARSYLRVKVASFVKRKPTAKSSTASQSARINSSSSNASNESGAVCSNTQVPNNQVVQQIKNSTAANKISVVVPTTASSNSPCDLSNTARENLGSSNSELNDFVVVGTKVLSAPGDSPADDASSRTEPDSSNQLTDAPALDELSSQTLPDTPSNVSTTGPTSDASTNSVVSTFNPGTVFETPIVNSTPSPILSTISSTRDMSLGETSLATNASIVSSFEILHNVSLNEITETDLTNLRDTEISSNTVSSGENTRLLSSNTGAVETLLAGELMNLGSSNTGAVETLSAGELINLGSSNTGAVETLSAGELMNLGSSNTGAVETLSAGELINLGSSNTGAVETLSAGELINLGSSNANTKTGGPESPQASDLKQSVTHPADIVDGKTEKKLIAAQNRKRKASDSDTDFTEPRMKKYRGPIQHEKQYCLFCYCQVTNLSSHVIRYHSKEPEVVEILGLKLSASTHEKFLHRVYRLRCLGNFHHNVQILLGRRIGHFAVVKRVTEKRQLSEYLPCLYCYGFYLAVNLERHMDVCTLREESERNDYYGKLSFSEYLLASACLTSQDGDWTREVKESVLPGVAEDIRRVVENDRLVLRCGALLLKMQNGHTRQVAKKIEKLGQLLRGLQNTSEPKNHHQYLQSFINSSSVPEVIKVCEKLSGMGEDCTFREPLFAKGLGFLLAVVGNVRRGWAMQCGNKLGQQEAETFLSRLLSDPSEVLSLRANLGRVRTAPAEMVAPEGQVAEDDAGKENSDSACVVSASKAPGDIRSSGVPTDTMTSGETTDTMTAGVTTDTVPTSVTTDTMTSGVTIDTVSTAATTDIASTGVSLSTAPTGVTPDTVPTGVTTDIVPTGVTTDTMTTGVTTDTVPTGVTTDIFPTGVTTDTVPTSVTTDTTSPYATTDTVTTGGTTGTMTSGVTTDTAPTGVTTDIVPTGVTTDTVPTSVTTDTTSPYVTTGVTTDTVTTGGTTDTMTSGETTDTMTAGVTTDTVPTSVTTDTMTSGVTIDTVPTGVTTDTVPKGVTTDTIPTGVTTDTTSPYVTTDTMTTGITTDIMTSVVTTDIMTSVVTTDIVPTGVTTDTVPTNVTTDTTAPYVTTDTMTSGVTTDTAPTGVTTDTVTTGGTTDTMTSGVTTDTAPTGVTTDTAPTGVTTDTMTSGVTTDTVLTDATIDKVSRDPNTDLTFSRVPEDSLFPDAATDTVPTGGTTDTMTSGVTTDTVLTDATIDTVSRDPNTDLTFSRVPVDSLFPDAAMDTASAHSAIDIESILATIDTLEATTDDRLLTGATSNNSSSPATKDVSFGEASDTQSTSSPTATLCQGGTTQPDSDIPGNSSHPDLTAITDTGAITLVELMDLVTSGGTSLDNVYACDIDTPEAVSSIEDDQTLSSGAGSTSMSVHADTVGWNTEGNEGGPVSAYQSAQTRGEEDPAETSHGDLWSSHNTCGNEDAAHTPLKTGKLTSKSLHYCYFCKTQHQSIIRHLKKFHSKEPQVREFWILKQSNPKAYRNAMDRLRRLGDFLYVIDVFQAGDAKLRVARKSSKCVRQSAYFLPCVYCYGLYVRSQLVRHANNCGRGENSGNFFKFSLLNRYLLESACLHDMDERWEAELREVVLPLMTWSSTVKVAEGDRLILRFGEVHVKILGRPAASKIAEKMRRLAKLLMILEEMDPSQKGLDSFLRPENFDRVKTAAEQLHGIRGSNKRRKTLQDSGVGRSTILLLAIVTIVKQGWAFQNERKQDVADCENFFACLEKEWSRIRPTIALAKASAQQRLDLACRQAEDVAVTPVQISGRVLRSGGTNLKSSDQRTDPDDHSETEVRSKSKNRKQLSPLDSGQQVDPDYHPEIDAGSKSRKRKQLLTTVSGQCVDPDYHPETKIGTKSRKRKQASATDTSKDEDNSPSKVRKRAPSERNKWTEEELTILKKVFGEFLKGNFYPTGRALQEVVEQNPCLKGRTVAQMRSKLQHLKRDM